VSAVPPITPDSRATRWLAVLLLGYALLLAWRLGDAPVHRSNEVRVDTVVRGMVATGDLLVPRLEDEVRLQKPPLYYWCATLAARIAGGAGNLPLRVPAALASLALVVIAWSWGRRLGGPRLGLLAAILVACMPGVGQFGRLGVAESLLAACCAAAMLAWEHAREGGSAGARLGFVAALAGAILAKGTPALLVVGVPVLADLLLRRRLRAALTWRNIGLLALACLPAAAWYAAVFLVVPGAWDEVVSFVMLPFGVTLPKAHGNAAHVRPFWYHAAALVGLTVPFALVLPALLRDGARSRFWRHASGLRLVALSVALPFTGFSLIPEKQDHYLLPILPAFGVLLGATILDLAAAAAKGARGLRIAAVACAILLLASFAACEWVARGALDFGWPASVALGLPGVVAATMALDAAWRARPLAFAGWLASGVFVVMLFFFGWVDPERQSMEAGVAEPAAVAHWNEVAARDRLLGGLFFAAAGPGDR